MNGVTKCACLVVAVTILASAPAFTEDHFSGTWVADVANSIYMAGPHAKATTQTVEAYGNELRIDSWAVLSDGRRLHNDARFTFDGIEHALPGSPDRAHPNTVTATKIDEFNFETTVTNTKDKVVILTREFFSQDGKTRTSMITRTYPDGQTVTSTIVWNRR
jgi:hypothetical protein